MRVCATDIESLINERRRKRRWGISEQPVGKLRVKVDHWGYSKGKGILKIKKSIGKDKKKKGKGQGNPKIIMLKLPE